MHLGQDIYKQQLQVQAQKQLLHMPRENGISKTLRTDADKMVVLKPVILTAQGGIEPGAQKIGEVIHQAVASETGIALPKVRNTFAIKLSVTILHSNARAVRRRDSDRPNATR